MSLRAGSSGTEENCANVFRRYVWYVSALDYVIIFDVDSKDTSVGISSPPQAFVDRTFLTRLHSLLSPSGQCEPKREVRI